MEILGLLKLSMDGATRPYMYYCKWPMAMHKAMYKC